MNAESGKPKAKRRWPREAALRVARELCAALGPATVRLCVAGSLRRGKAEVGDVEVLFIPRFEERQIDLFNVEPVNLAEVVIAGLMLCGTLQARVSASGMRVWGLKNKLAVHVPSGIPVDLFAATEENWWNYLVCRTGPKESNIQISNAARRSGWLWHPYGPGFSRAGSREYVAMTSEREVFEFVRLPYREPPERG